MKAFCYGVWIQFLMDLRSRSLFITCYLVPLLFFFMMGSVFTSIMPEYQDTLIASMTIMSVSMGSLLGLSSSVVQIYGTTLQKTYMANSLPVYYGLMTLFVSAFFHLMIVSTLILVLSPILFHATLPSHIGIYYLHLILFIISSLGIASVLGLFVKTQGLLTMMSQIIFLPSIILSGIMFPASMLPSFLENLGKLFPATWGYLLLTQSQGQYILILIMILALLICFQRMHSFYSFIK